MCYALGIEGARFSELLVNLCHIPEESIPYSYRLQNLKYRVLWTPIEIYSNFLK
jgi:hypothetical protein